MAHQLFSEDWARAWKAAINESEAYRNAASRWRWPLTVRIDQGEAWYLDLFEGVCREMRPARPEDKADFEIAGPREAWMEVLRGGRSPVMAITKGALRLDRGSLVKVARFAPAAKALLQAATASEFPETPNGSEGSKTVGEPASEGGLAFGAHHAGFRSTSATGLDFESFPMQLYGKAKRLGIWDPAEIDFSQDAKDWGALSPPERDLLTRLVAMFGAGEEAVTLDLLPLVRVLAAEGRVEETMYLTTFLFEEAKHTEFFRRFLDAVGMTDRDLSVYHSEGYRALFYEELPATLSRLDSDPSPVAQMNASATYNMIVEGVLAETGYHALHDVLQQHSILPGLMRGTGLLQRDESRHIAFGVHLLSRLIRQDPALHRQFEERMETLLPMATQVISEIFSPYDPMPFGLREQDFVNFALDQFRKRARRVEGAPSAEVLA